MRIAGRRMYLWRAVDQEGEILDLLTQPRRDKPAGKLLRKHGFAPTAGSHRQAALPCRAFRALRLDLPRNSEASLSALNLSTIVFLASGKVDVEQARCFAPRQASSARVQRFARASRRPPGGA